MNKQHLIEKLFFIAGIVVGVLVFSAIVRPLTDYPNTSGDFVGIARSRPYCAIDPLCINSITGNKNPYNVTLPSIAVGHAINEESQALSANNFSWPNYVAFVVVLMLTILVIRRLVRNMHLRAIAYGAIFGWYTAEWSRWLTTIEIFKQSKTTLLVYLALGVITIGLSVTLIYNLRARTGHVQKDT